MQDDHGNYIGLGLGDASEEIKTIKAYMRRMYRSYAGGLADTVFYDAEMVVVVSDMQNRLVASGKLKPDQFKLGVINAATKIAMGYIKPGAKVLPRFFTVEGHLSDMYAGPCAFTAKALEDLGLVKWRPTGYDNVSLPFNDASGVAALDDRFSDVNDFPLGTPWLLSVFSQGALVGCQFFLDQVLNPQGKHSRRLQDWKGTLAHGNPMRQKDVNALWVPDGPRAGTSGIYKRHMTGTAPGELLYPRWREVNRTGDLYAENEDSEAGKNKTAVCSAVVDGELMGAGTLSERLWYLAMDFPQQVWPLAQSIISGVKFLSNMNPHGAYDLAPGIEWCKERLTA